MSEREVPPHDSDTEDDRGYSSPQVSAVHGLKTGLATQRRSKRLLARHITTDSLLGPVEQLSGSKIGYDPAKSSVLQKEQFFPTTSSIVGIVPHASCTTVTSSLLPKTPIKTNGTTPTVTCSSQTITTTHHLAPPPHPNTVTTTTVGAVTKITSTTPGSSCTGTTNLLASTPLFQHNKSGSNLLGLVQSTAPPVLTTTPAVKRTSGASSRKNTVELLSNGKNGAEDKSSSVSENNSTSQQSNTLPSHEKIVTVTSEDQKCTSYSNPPAGVLKTILSVGEDEVPPLPQRSYSDESPLKEGKFGSSAVPGLDDDEMIDRNHSVQLVLEEGGCLDSSHSGEEFCVEETGGGGGRVKTQSGVSHPVPLVEASTSSGCSRELPLLEGVVPKNKSVEMTTTATAVTTASEAEANCGAQAVSESSNSPPKSVLHEEEDGVDSCTYGGGTTNGIKNTTSHHRTQTDAVVPLVRSSAANRKATSRMTYSLLAGSRLEKRQRHEEVVTAALSGGDFRSCVKDFVKPFVIGVCGATCSGKTTLCNIFRKALRNDHRVAFIPSDAFYKDLGDKDRKLAHAAQYDFDHPDAIAWDELTATLQALKQGFQAVEIPRYDFCTHSRVKNGSHTRQSADRSGGGAGGESIKPADVIIVEGILIYAVGPDLRNEMDMKIFVDCDADVILARRLQRDIAERGREFDNVLKQYMKFVKPSYENFIEPSKRYADVVIPNTKEAEMEKNNAILMMTQHIKHQLDKRNSARRLMRGMR
ncbi:unnamed protein product [Amoebophrya sp. A120]|nr:unnamed protein product [Amoebophrya sp. A120]|eukprot:GSA120T00003454001.1